MGNQGSSIYISGGALEGAYAPATREITPGMLPGKRERTFETKVPLNTKGLTTGKATKLINFQGKQIKVKIPQGLRAGEKFTFTIDTLETDKIYASTLPFVTDGMELIASKPIIFASVSLQFLANSDDQQSMGKEVGQLLQKAQKKILEEVIKVECNACLGMSFNVTNDSAGDTGRAKVVVVTAVGTPCVVMPKAQVSPPIAQAEVLITPLYQGNPEGTTADESVPVTIVP